MRRVSLEQVGKTEMHMAHIFTRLTQLFIYFARQGVPTAILSRQMAGSIGKSLVVNLPGNFFLWPMM